MKNQKRGKPISFRPIPFVAERLEMAQLAGYDVSEVINTVLKYGIDDSLATNLDAKLERLRELRKSLKASA